MITIVMATRNAHKVAEIRQMLPGNIRLLSQVDFPNAPSVIEDAETFAGNATKKAEAFLYWLTTLGHQPTDLSNASFFVLADDSGLEVDALDGAPGVHSARFAAADPHGTENSPDAANNAKLIRLLADVAPEKRTARFRCVLALSSKGMPVRIFDGACEGRMAIVPSGGAGFGYDPLFVPEDCAQSFAELGESVKNKISHRARALAKLRLFLDELS